MKYIFNLLIITSLIGTLAGCSQSQNKTTAADPNVNTVVTAEGQTYWVAYRQLACTTPPWVENAKANTEVKIDPASIIQYYQTKHNITVLTVTTATDPSANTCTDCGCQTGTVVQAQVASEFDRDTLLVVGFTEALAEPLASNESSAATIDTTTDSHSIDAILQERSETLGETYTPDDSTSGSTLSSDEKTITDVTDPAENQTTHRTGDDGIIEQNAKYVQQSLWVYSFEAGHYPTELTELDLTGVDLTGITYIPAAGDQPTDFQIKAEYSDSIEIYHPL